MNEHYLAEIDVQKGVGLFVCFCIVKETNCQEKKDLFFFFSEVEDTAN